MIIFGPPFPVVLWFFLGLGLFSEQLQVLCSLGFGVQHQSGCPAAARSRCNCR
jgi:hypothetical protein